MSDESEHLIEQAEIRDTAERLTIQALAQHERIRLLEEWMHDIIHTWHVSDIKPEQINRGRFLLED